MTSSRMTIVSHDSPAERAWYRTAGRGARYHVEGPAWVRTGRMLCGARVARAAFVWDGASPAPGPVCKRCWRAVGGDEPAAPAGPPAEGVLREAR